MVPCDWSLTGYVERSERWGQALRSYQITLKAIFSVILILFHHKPPSTPNFTFLSVEPPFCLQTLKCHLQVCLIIVSRHESESFLYSEHSCILVHFHCRHTTYQFVPGLFQSCIGHVSTFFFLSEFLTSCILLCCWSWLNEEHSDILLPTGKALFLASILNTYFFLLNTNISSTISPIKDNRIEELRVISSE